MSTTSSAVKNRWNAKNYDRMSIVLPKGQKDLLKAACAEAGVSMNSVFADAASRFLAEHGKQANQ